MNELAELFRNAIELNRYSNSISRRIIESYNDRVLDAIDELAAADGLSGADQAEKLRAILQELKIELQAWGAFSTALMIDEMQELAVVQARFSEQELGRVVPRVRMSRCGVCRSWRALLLLLSCLTPRLGMLWR